MFTCLAGLTDVKDQNKVSVITSSELNSFCEPSEMSGCDRKGWKNNVRLRLPVGQKAVIGQNVIVL